jgi:hypothetical protein
MRNPWGPSEQWKGKYSDDDEVWTKEDYAEQVGHVKRNDGMFFISIEDFLDSFSAFTAALRRHGAVHSQFESLNDNGSTKRVKFEITEALTDV